MRAGARGVVTSVPTTRLDIMAAETAADPWPLLRELRAQGPVVWHEVYKRWLVTTDREVRAVVGDFQRFTLEGTSSAALFGDDAFISIDDRKRHDALRLVWGEAFRLQGLERLRPQVETIAAGLLEPVAQRLRDGEPVEMVSAVCRPLPTLVIALMMGVPRAMLGDVVRWSDEMAGGGPAYLADAAAQAAVRRREAAKGALADYLGELLRERRARPGEDLVSTLAASEVARRCSDDQLVQNLRQLLFAGNETTAKWLAHLFVTYAEEAGVRREIAADRALIRPANDEVMRWQGVVGTLVRRVRGGAVELAGVALADGDEVTCVLASANRDPARFAEPDRLDIHRPPQPNLGFGVGLHHCLGINLAKLEGEIVIGGFLDRLPDFRVAEPYSYSSLPLRGPQPVTLAAGRGTI